MRPSEYVLLVEDNKKDELLAIRVFSKADEKCHVEVVRDGQAALDFIADCISRSLPLPKLIILDLNLPKISGLDVLKKIKQNRDTELTPIVMLSSSDDKTDILTSYKWGANGYVCKPVAYTDYAQKIGQLWEYWLSVNQGAASA